MAGGQPDWTVCTSPYVVSGLSPAEHVLQVRAVDMSGNVDDVNGNVDNPGTPDALDPTDGVPAVYVWTVGAAPVNRTVFCGQKITQSTRLNNNLGDCIGHGLIVGADKITIDLNGKTIDGKSIGAAILNNGYKSVTIKNGRLTDYDFGVMLNNGAKLNIVEGVTADLNQEAGISLGHGTFPEDPTLAPSEPVPGFQSRVDNTILRTNTLVSNKRGVWILNGARDNVVRGNLIGASGDDAVWIERANNNLVEGNDIQAASGAGVLLEGATDNTVRANSVVDVGAGVVVSHTTTGATIGIESTGNRVVGNTVSDSAGAAFEIVHSSQNEIVDNVARVVSSDAIELYFGFDNLIKGNDVANNKGGISLRESTGNTIEGNDASNSDSTGISLESQSFSNVLLNNVSSNNEGGGIYLGDETPAGQGTLVQGNTTNSNKEVGIKANKPAHIFKDNVAFDNDSWGIHVGDPSNGRANIDGGGNVAQNNLGPLGIDLKPQQCYNITCLAGPGGGDSIAPNTSILDGPIQPESSESVAVFRFSGADNASPVTFECRSGTEPLAAGAEWEVCESPETLTDLTNDTYSFEVRAIDFTGNIDPTPATYTWSVVLGDVRGVDRLDAGQDHRRHEGDLRVLRQPRQRRDVQVPPRRRGHGPDGPVGDGADLHLAHDLLEPGAGPARVLGQGHRCGQHLRHQDVRLDHRTAAGRRPGDLRADPHAEHARAQRPGRLWRPRPHRRSTRHHDRPRRSRHRRPGAGCRHPQQRTPRRHDQERPRHPVPERRPAQPRDRPQRRAATCGSRGTRRRPSRCPTPTRAATATRSATTRSSPTSSASRSTRALATR